MSLNALGPFSPTPGKGFIRRAPDGTFINDQTNVGRSLSADNIQLARRDEPGGQAGTKAIEGLGRFL